MKKTRVLIVGASAAGLSCGALLQEKGIDNIILEASDHVAQKWRSHYDRLHLHTNKGNSTLPGLAYPKGTPKYPSKKQLISYLETYTSVKKINPHFNQEVRTVEKIDGTWKTTTDTDVYESDFVIVCTGKANHPHFAEKKGLDSFQGEVIHSSQYKNGKPYENKRVLVVGFGNSACEIAICLFEHKASPSFSVRGAVNVIPRDILGIPVLQIGILQGGLPPKVSDTLNKPLLRLLVGNIENYGLEKLPYGPREQIIHHGKIPLLDIGTMKLIRDGKVGVYKDIDHIQGQTVHFIDGKSADFDTIILATGYKDGLGKIVKVKSTRLDDARRSIKERKNLGKDGIYFCGFYVSPTGMLREIKIEAQKITNHLENQCT